MGNFVAPALLSPRRPVPEKGGSARPGRCGGRVVFSAPRSGCRVGPRAPPRGCAAPGRLPRRDRPAGRGRPRFSTPLGGPCPAARAELPGGRLPRGPLSGVATSPGLWLRSRTAGGPAVQRQAPLRIIRPDDHPVCCNYGRKMEENILKLQNLQFVVGVDRLWCCSPGGDAAQKWFVCSSGRTQRRAQVLRTLIATPARKPSGGFAFSISRVGEVQFV
ncbi:uncharacterized protein LOC115598879 [Calypte anna]|uniref:uncharacterized protein LOC115598879 n=1 Tax=Calypte anna TaxID=9244 RepID=UPI0011C3EC59|nr:uncharacterized protein LOC115598879 [Calypte anna]